MMPIVQTMAILARNPDNEENNAKNNQGKLLTADGRPVGRKKNSR